MFLGENVAFYECVKPLKLSWLASKWYFFYKKTPAG